jgi:hypothetical protein
LSKRIKAVKKRIFILMNAQSPKTRIGKAHTNEEEKMPKPKDNDAWQTGDSRIPENASDNPNS